MDTEHRTRYNLIEDAAHVSENGIKLTDRNKQEEQTLERRRMKLRKLKSNADFSELGSSELELKANLYYHISNPLKRLKTDCSPPVTLVLQIAKAICIVTQAVYFLSSSTNNQSYVVKNTQRLFSCALLNQCDSKQTYYAYSIGEMQRILNTSCMSFNNLNRLDGTFIPGYGPAKTDGGSMLPIQVILTQYANVQLNPGDESYIDTTYKTVSFQLDPLHDVIQQFNNQSEDSSFVRLVRMDLVMNLNNIEVVSSSVVQCYSVTITIHFQAQGGGIIEYYVTSSRKCSSCGQNSTLTLLDNHSSLVTAKTVLDGIVLIVCGASLLAVIISEQGSYKLAKAMGSFYKKQLNIDLSWKDRAAIFSPGYMFDIASDLLTITGTIMKIKLDYDSCLLTPSASAQTNVVRIFLGVGILLQAAVILRFVSYFQQFNAVYRVLSIALPRLGKYIVCALILFLAFMVCGWLVLGPFHYKFMTFGESFQALYTMMHGDDLYPTYQGITAADDMEVYVFSQMFFTTFLMLFIYAMLNLMISLIMESYEESQMQDLALKNEVRRFVYSGPLTGQGIALRDVTAVTKYVEPSLILHRASNHTAR